MCYIWTTRHEKTRYIIGDSAGDLKLVLFTGTDCCGDRERNYQEHFRRLWCLVGPNTYVTLARYRLHGRIHYSIRDG